MTNRDLQRILNAHGFPAGPVDGVIGKRTLAGVKRFQQAYLAVLPVDGTIDIATLQAVQDMDTTGKLSPNFTVAELRSKGNGNCFIRRELLEALEALRRYKDKPLSIISGYRDWDYHKEVYRRLGKPVVRGSKHLIGGAADFNRTYNLRLDEALSLRLFSGIGYLSKSHRVTHVDVRHRLQRTGFTVDKPSTWEYKE